MKFITLRIYNSTPDYDEMYKLHKQFDSNSIFLTASSSVIEASYDTETNILTVPGTESLIPGILHKTIKGIDYCLKHFDFDVLIRSNMSTIIDYDELEKQLLNTPKPIYGGHIWSYTIVKDNIQPEWFNFISGCCIVVDRDICSRLVCGNFMYLLEDDVEIGYYLSKLYPITFSTQYDDTCEKQSASCFYRFRKDMSRYDQRAEDIENMKHFYEKLYTIIITSITNKIDSVKNSNIPNIAIYTDESPFPRKDLNPRLQSKYFKMCGHTLFPDKKYIIWIDGAIQITQEIIHWLIYFMGDSDCAFIQHHARNSVMDELTHVEDEMKKGNKYLLDRYQHEPMRLQVENYMKEGFIDNKLLFGAIFIRKNNPKVNNAFDNWFIENVKWSIQDQLSLPYIIWKYQLKVNIIPPCFYWGGPHHKYVGHHI